MIQSKTVIQVQFLNCPLHCNFFVLDEVTLVEGL